MDIYSKLFLANILSMFLMASIDKVILRDALEYGNFSGPAMGIWALITILSIPVYLFYLIITA